MSSRTEREVARKLAERPEQIEPPPDLLERIKAEIPPELPAIRLAPPNVADVTLPFERRAAPPARRLWLVAASLVMIVGAALFSLRVMERVSAPALDEAETAVEAPSAAPEPGAPGFAGEAQEAAEPPPPPAAAPPAVQAPPSAPEERLEKLTRELDAVRKADASRAGAGGGADKEISGGRRSEAAQDQLAAPGRHYRLAGPQEPASVPSPPPPAPPRPELKDRRANEAAPQERRRDDDRQWAGRFFEQKAAGARDKAAGAQDKTASGKGKVAAKDQPAGAEGGVVGGAAGAANGELRVEDEITVTAEAPQIVETPALGASIGTSDDSETQAAPRARRRAETRNAEPKQAETKGEAPDAMVFRSAGTNPFVDAEEDPLSTFGLDVDTASYTVTRRYLADGHLPPPESVRVEEFVNFFHYGDPPPARGDFALRAEGAPTPFAAGERYRLLRFSIRAREVAARDRKPAVLTFVVDVSGSMAREDRLGAVKRALDLLVGQLGANDKVGLVIYGSRGEVVLEPTGDRAAIRRALERLVANGSTNAEEGLRLAYDVAGRAFRFGGVNRVILCSDGVANVGLTDADGILARIGREARRGIELTTVGFGMGNYNDLLMERLADAGDGRYAYVDSMEEARRIFVDDLTGMLQSVARDAKAQVELNPKAVASYRLLGYENRDIADSRFRDDTVDAGEIGAGHQVTALYEIKLQPNAQPSMRLADLHLRYRSTETGKVEEVEKLLRVGDLARSFEQASPALRLAAVAAELAEILRGSPWAKDASLADVLRRSRQLAADFPAGPEAPRVRELAELVLRTVQLDSARARRHGE